MEILLSNTDKKTVTTVADAAVVTVLVDDRNEVPQAHSDLTKWALEHKFKSVAPLSYKLSKDGRFKLFAFRDARSSGFSSFSDLK